VRLWIYFRDTTGIPTLRLVIDVDGYVDGDPAVEPVRSTGRHNIAYRALKSRMLRIDEHRARFGVEPIYSTLGV